MNRHRKRHQRLQRQSQSRRIHSPIHQHHRNRHNNPSTIKRSLTRRRPCSQPPHHNRRHSMRIRNSRHSRISTIHRRQLPINIRQNNTRSMNRNHRHRRRTSKTSSRRKLTTRSISRQSHRRHRRRISHHNSRQHLRNLTLKRTRHLPSNIQMMRSNISTSRLLRNHRTSTSPRSQRRTRPTANSIKRPQLIVTLR